LLPLDDVDMPDQPESIQSGLVAGELEVTVASSVEGREWVALSAAEAGRFPDLILLGADLEFAVGVLERLVGDLEQLTRDIGPDLPGLSTALRDDFKARFNGALVSYARCFISGVRRPLAAPWVDTLNDEDRGRHGRYISLRDKHVGHSVSSQETARVLIGLLLAADPPTAQGIVEVAHSNLLPSVSALRRFLGLAQSALAYVDGERQIERDRVRSLIASLGMEGLAPRPRASTLPRFREKSRRADGPSSNHRNEMAPSGIRGPSSADFYTAAVSGC
jgi:hypothetical protein